MKDIEIKHPGPPIESFDEMVSAMLPLDKLQPEFENLNAEYLSAEPFPHVVLDGLFSPMVLDRIISEFPEKDKRDWFHWKSRHEDKTTSRGIENLPGFTQLFFLLLNSEGFINCLKKISGYSDLVPDPTYFGAGLQETFKGGWLNVHADYTRHPHLPLTRRLTMLLYLNKDWTPDWKGELELWDQEKKSCIRKYPPLFNRMVLFPALPEALHGQPSKLDCPENSSRKFVSVTYWTADQSAAEKAQGIRWLRPDGSLAGPPVRLVPRSK